MSTEKQEAARHAAREATKKLRGENYDAVAVDPMDFNAIPTVGSTAQTKKRDVML